jgi:peptide/nickel transport system substrate-binding protein
VVVKQIDRETNTTQRKALVCHAEDILEQDPPLLPVAWEKIYDGWYTYAKGHHPTNNFGMYDVVRWDRVWQTSRPTLSNHHEIECQGA